jgi:hypothetical protein
MKINSLIYSYLLEKIKFMKSINKFLWNQNIKLKPIIGADDKISNNDYKKKNQNSKTWTLLDFAQYEIGGSEGEEGLQGCQNISDNQQNTL